MSTIDETAQDHDENSLTSGQNGAVTKTLPDMPIDVLLEIFDHLGPEDLLILTRTSKDFRAFLRSPRKAGLLWKSAMQGLPECPPQLSQLAWVNFLFSTHCHGCLQENVGSMLWEFGVRYCPACKRRNTTTFSKLFSDFFQRPHSDAQCPAYISHMEYSDTVHIPEVSEFKHTWSKLRQTDRDAFIEKRTAQVAEMSEIANKASQWWSNRQRRLEEEAQILREQRKKDIFSKLEGLGWLEEIDKLPSDQRKAFEKNPHFRRARKLTEAEWLDIRDELVKVLEKRKVARLDAERRDTIKARLQILQSVLSASYSTAPLRRRKSSDPDLTTIAAFPAVRAIVDLPLDEEITSESFKPIIDALPALTAAWHAGIKATLGKQFRNCATGTYDGLSDGDLVDLAVCVLRCTECSETLVFPALVSHRCLDTVRKSASRVSDRYVNIVAATTCRTPWTAAHVRCTDVAGVLAACGLSWETATAGDLDRRDERFVCVSGGAALSWRDVIDHCLDGPHRAQELRFELLGSSQADEDDDERRARVLEERERKWWCCALCIPRIMDGLGVDTWSGIREHVVQAHHIAAEDIQDKDMFLHPNGRLMRDSKECRRPGVGSTR